MCFYTQKISIRLQKKLVKKPLWDRLFSAEWEDEFVNECQPIAVLIVFPDLIAIHLSQCEVILSFAEIFASKEMLTKMSGFKFAIPLASIKY